MQIPKHDDLAPEFDESIRITMAQLPFVKGAKIVEI